MNLDQVYDELYGAIDENLRSDTTLAGRVGTLETKVNTLEGKMTAAEGDIDALEAVIPKVPGRQLKLVDLGTEFTDELKEDIYTGAFEKAIVGGYLTINDHVYIFAHPDYFLGRGEPAVEDHHMVVIPATYLTSGKMNQTDITTGGYVSSDMRAGHEDTTDPSAPVHVNGALEDAIAIIENDFGADNILTHKINLTNAVSGNSASGWGWIDSKADLLSEFMVYGANVEASSYHFETGICNSQLKLFAERPDLIAMGDNYWLRTIYYAGSFAYVTDGGGNNRSGASINLKVRPFFCIKGTAPEPTP